MSKAKPKEFTDEGLEWKPQEEKLPPEKPATIMLTLTQRIMQVWAEVETIDKDHEIGDGKWSYTVVTHDAVTRALHRPLVRAGVFPLVTQTACEVTSFEVSAIDYKTQKEYKKTQYRADVTAEITFINIDDQQDRLTCSAKAYAFDQGDKAVGKAFSMAVKMIMLKNFGLESRDMEEAREDERYEKKTPPSVAKPPPAKVEPKPKPENHAPISTQQKKHLLDLAESKGIKPSALNNKMEVWLEQAGSQFMNVTQYESLVTRLMSDAGFVESLKK